MKKKDIKDILDREGKSISKTKLYELTNEWLGKYGERNKYWKGKKKKLKEIHDEEHKMRVRKQKTKSNKYLLRVKD